MALRYPSSVTDSFAMPLEQSDQTVTWALTRKKTFVVALIGISSGLTAFDETSLGVVLPTLQQEFQTTPNATHWVVNAYLLVMASLVAVCGRLADFLPADVLWRAGLVVFTLTSLAAGLSPDIGWLIAIRAVQGIGAALIFTSSVALIAQVFADNERGREFGIFSSFIAILFLFGPIAGGLLTEFLSWRWVFWVTVPPALLCLWRFQLPPAPVQERNKRRQLDLAGLVSLILCIATLTVGLMQGVSWSWTSPLILCFFAVSIASGIAFVVIENRTSAPLIDLGLFRDKSVAASIMTLFMAQYRRVGTSIYLALFLRDGMGLSPLFAGIALLPAFALLPLSTIMIGRAADRFGARVVMLTGIAVIGVSVLLIALASEMRSYWVLFPALLLISCFAPTMFGPSRKAMLHALAPNHNAQLSGVSVTAQMMGSTLTISIGSVLLSMTGTVSPIFLVMSLALAGLWLVAFFWLDRPS